MTTRSTKQSAAEPAPDDQTEQQPAPADRIVTMTAGDAAGWSFNFHDDGAGFRLPAFKSTPAWFAWYGTGPAGERGLWLWADARAASRRLICRIPLVVARVIQRDGEGRKSGFLYLIAADDSGTAARELTSCRAIERRDAGYEINVPLPATSDFRSLIIEAVVRLGDQCPVVIEQIPQVDPVTGRYPTLDATILPSGYGELAPGASADHLASWLELAPVIAAHPKIALVLGMNAFAPFIAPLARQSRILNLTGPGRQGKTTTLRLSAAVWGRPGYSGLRRMVRSWNASAQGLPQALGRLGVLPGYFDEQGSGDSRAGEMMKIAYSMVEGNSRTMGTVDGLGRTTPGWAGLIMSTSNASMLARVQTTGAGAGIPARLLEVDAPFTTTAEAASSLDHLAQSAYGHVGVEILTRFGIDDATALVRWAQDLMPIPEEATVSRTIRQHWHDAIAGAVMLDTAVGTGTLIQDAAIKAAHELAGDLVEPLGDAETFLAELRDRMTRDPSAWPTIAAYEAWTLPRADINATTQQRNQAALPQHGVREVQGIRSDDDAWVGVIPSAWQAIMEDLQTDSATVCRWLFERGLMEVMPSERERGEWKTKLPRIKVDGKPKRILAYKVRLIAEPDTDAAAAQPVDATPAPANEPAPVPEISAWVERALGVIPTLTAEELDAADLTTALDAGQESGQISAEDAGRLRAARAARLAELSRQAAPVPAAQTAPAGPVAQVPAARRAPESTRPTRSSKPATAPAPTTPRPADAAGVDVVAGELVGYPVALPAGTRTLVDVMAWAGSLELGAPKAGMAWQRHDGIVYVSAEAAALLGLPKSAPKPGGRAESALTRAGWEMGLSGLTGYTSLWRRTDAGKLSRSLVILPYLAAERPDAPEFTTMATDDDTPPAARLARRQNAFGTLVDAPMVYTGGVTGMALLKGRRPVRLPMKDEEGRYVRDSEGRKLFRQAPYGLEMDGAEMPRPIMHAAHPDAADRAPADVCAEEDFMWIRGGAPDRITLTDSERAGSHGIGLDTMTSFASVLERLSVPLGAYEQTGPIDLNRKGIAGFGYADLSQLETEPELPHFATGGGQRPTGPGWYALHTLKYARSAYGWDGKVTKGYVTERTGALFEPWWPPLRDAYLALMARAGVTAELEPAAFLAAHAQYKDHADPDTLALLGMVKSLYKDVIGKFRQGPQGVEPEQLESWLSKVVASPWHRPDVRAYVLSAARTTSHYRYRKTFQANGRAPFAVSHDRAVYAAPSASPLDLTAGLVDASGKPLAGVIRLGVRPGSMKLEGIAPLSDLLERAGELRRNPADLVTQYTDGIYTPKGADHDGRE